MSFPRGAFEDPSEMSALCRQCDVLVHFAGLSRHPDGKFLLNTNLRLIASLIEGLKHSGSHAHVYLASTTHEQRSLPYHESKRRSRQMFEEWAAGSGNPYTTLLMPNTFGPYARPFFNSVVSTFCYQAAHGQTPDRIDPAELKLIHVRTLCREILRTVRRNEPGVTAVEIPHEYEIRLDRMWKILQNWRGQLSQGKTPLPADPFETGLLETFLSYCE